MQAGFVIGSNNSVVPILEKKLPNNLKLESVITSSGILGMIIGSFFSGCVISYGRRRAIILMNLLIILSCSASLVLNIWAIITAKFVQGFAAGALINACNIYVVETCPSTKLGLFGSYINIGTVTGLWLSLFIIVFEINFGKTNIWRFIYGLPIPFAIISLILSCCVFKTESLMFCIKHNKSQEALLLISHLYVSDNSYLHS